MAFYTISDITGAKILNQSDRASIGKWNEARIDFDKTTNGDLSVIGLAISYYSGLATPLGVDLDALTPDNEALINASIIWYICGEYKRRDIEDMPKDQCTPDDYRLQANFYKRACEFMKLVSPSMASSAEFCSFSETDKLESSDFSVSGFTYECGDSMEINAS